MQRIPIDLWEVLLLRLPITTLLRIIPSNRRLLVRATKWYYWQQYFMLRPNPPQFFHQSLLALANNKYYIIFQQLWSEKKLAVIREDRTLIEGYQAAALNGNSIAARAIFMLDEEWMTEQFDIFQPSLDDWMVKFDWIERAFKVRHQAATNNLPFFLIAFGKLMLFVIDPGLDEMQVPKYVEHTLLAAFADANDYEFVTAVLHWLEDSYLADVINDSRLGNYLFNRGCHDLVTKLIAGGYLNEMDIN